MKRLVLIAAPLLLGLGCASGPERRGDVAPPTLISEALEVPSQGLTDFQVKYQGVLQSGAPVTIESARYELVVDGKVVKTGERPLGIEVAPGAPASFELAEASRYVQNSDELKALDRRAGTLLVAMRGKLQLREGKRKSEVDFARAREIRLPRMPKVVLHDLDAGRYSDTEVNGTVYVGVLNPNPFPIHLNALSYQLVIGGEKVAEGIRGQGEKVSASATGVFEMPFTLDEKSHGANAKKLIATRTLPYEVKGELKGDLLDAPFALDGEIRLNVSR